MRKLKKTVSYSLTAVAIGALTAGLVNMPGILAYMTDGGELTNTLTVGENIIEVDENFPDPEIETGENTYTKDVKVKNTGDVPCYVRVFLEFSDNDVRGESKVSPDGTTFYTMSEFNSHLPEGWVYVNDAADALAPYYYYTAPLAVNASTPSLIKSVKTTFATADNIEPFDIYVYAESIQTLDKYGQAFTGTDQWRSAWTEYLGNNG